jgi:hypothetical protein
MPLLWENQSSSLSKVFNRIYIRITTGDFQNICAYPLFQNPCIKILRVKLQTFKSTYAYLIYKVIKSYGLEQLSEIEENLVISTENHF